MSPPNYRRAKRAHRELWYNGPVRAARMVCDVAGRAVAAAVSLSSSLEPPFISVGQALSATRAGKALYRCSREALSARIRATGRRHRRVDVLGTQISLDVTEREGHEPVLPRRSLRVRSHGARMLGSQRRDVHRHRRPHGVLHHPVRLADNGADLRVRAQPSASART